VENSQGMNFTTYLHLELRFRITKAVTILSLYVFMVQTGTAFLFVIKVTFLNLIFMDPCIVV